MAAVFSLTSDNQFVRTFKGYPEVFVCEYMDDPNVFDMIHARDYSRWKGWGAVGSSTSQATFKALEVFGVTITGDKLKELVKDLTVIDRDGQTFHLEVNRQGLCFMYFESQTITRFRINDHFGWSKYGVKPEISTIWSIWDMSNGAVLVAPPTMVQSSDESSSSEGWKKLVEEKDKEVASLKAALKALCDK